MTPLASVAMQEKLALLKIAFCSAVESSMRAAARASLRTRSDMRRGCRREKIAGMDQVLFFIARLVRDRRRQNRRIAPRWSGADLEVRGWWDHPAECSRCEHL